MSLYAIFISFYISFSNYFGNSQNAVSEEFRIYQSSPFLNSFFTKGCILRKYFSEKRLNLEYHWVIVSKDLSITHSDEFSLILLRFMWCRVSQNSERFWCMIAGTPLNFIEDVFQYFDEGFKTE